jgi:hypothetical protein
MSKGVAGQSPLAGLAGASFTTSKPLTLDLVLGYASRLQIPDYPCAGK